jgi:Tfp pilus assembly protein PilN
MIIEVNLLPNGQAKSALPFAGLTTRLRGTRDPYLAAAIVTLAVVVGAVGLLHDGQTRRELELADRASAAAEDSSRYATVISARKGAIAERDSVERQLGIIAAIDSNRYVWAHVLDEVSQTLPAYTWLTLVEQTSAAPAPPLAKKDEKPEEKSDKPPVRDPKADSIAALPQSMRFRLVGQTVDIQALTTFMRDLEASAFVQRVQLAKSEAVQVDGRDVTEFTLDGAFEAPPAGALRTRVVTVPLR